MAGPVTPSARPPSQLPWPAGWARRTFGPQYRPAVVVGVLCVLLAATLGIRNPADAFLIAVFAVGLFVWALRPAPAYPIRVSAVDLDGQRGAQFPLRITNPLIPRRPSVTLTPTAVVTHAGAPLVIPWSEITEVRASHLRTGVPHSLLPPPRQNWLTIGVADLRAIRGAGPKLAARFGGNTVAGFPTTSVLSNPLVLYHTLHYYLDNPQARPELATGWAVERIRAARVEPYDA
jgi:hypothetical protein